MGLLSGGIGQSLRARTFLFFDMKYLPLQAEIK